MSFRFEWDVAKARDNETKHDVTFDEAVTVFDDPLSLTIADPDHSETEDRFVTLGISVASRLLVVVHVERLDTIRIVSARPATRSEQRTYEEETEADD